MYLAVRPTRGRLAIFGTDIETAGRRALPRLRRRIGVVFQDFRLLPHLSAFDNVALPLRIAGRPEGQISADVGEMLRWVGLAKQAGARPAELSGGEQQRVAIARAVINRPSLLLADEPTGNLDEVQAERLMQLLNEMNRLGTTVVVATHNDALVGRHPAPALRLSHGRLVERAIDGHGFAPRATLLRPAGFDELGLRRAIADRHAAVPGGSDGIPRGAGAGRLGRCRIARTALAAGRGIRADRAGAAAAGAGGARQRHAAGPRRWRCWPARPASPRRGRSATRNWPNCSAPGWAAARNGWPCLCRR